MNVYNSVPSDQANLVEMCRDIHKQLQTCDSVDIEVTLADVNEAIKLLKHGKGDGKDNFVSDHLIYSSLKFRKKLAELCTSMYVHGSHPDVTLCATICSIPKDYSASLCEDSNYRGIDLSSSIAKIFDVIYLNRNSHKLDTSDLQFAFKKGLGTTMCTLVLKE